MADYHKWVTGETNQEPLNKLDKWTIWTCSVCNAQFKHYYGRHIDWTIDRSEADIPKNCGQIGLEQVLQELKEETKVAVDVEAEEEAEEEDVACVNAMVEDVETKAGTCFGCKVTDRSLSKLPVHGNDKELYCWNCLWTLKRKFKICGKCEKVVGNLKCKKCSGNTCAGCCIVTDTANICRECAKSDETLFAFLIGRAQYHNFDDVVMHFYSNPQKRQRVNN
jgi:hypothetical protein